MNDERIDEYLRGLDGLDAAVEWWPEDGVWDGFALSFDEWNARRVASGQAAGLFGDYVQAIKVGEHDVQQGG